MLKPATAVSTNQWANDHRVIKGRNELKAKWLASETPYVPGIQDACDQPGVEVVAVKGCARSGKTVAAENHALKRMVHGPYGDMLWYMQSSDDISDYMEERGEWMLEEHDQVAAKVDTKYNRQARDRKKIGSSLARWLAATDKTTRGKGAPFIVADEIDGYNVKIMKGLLTRLRNRQREFGSAALLYIASHPDKGPTFGVERVIAQGIRHLWWWMCIHCGKPSSPAAEAPIRMNWNIPFLIADMKGVDKNDVLNYVRQEAKLICPHCRGEISGAERTIMSRETGAWVQPAQKLIAPRLVEGPRLTQDIMGFVIHGFMSPFVNLGKAAAEWTAAKIEFDINHDDEELRQSTVKTLGEVYEGAADEVKIDDWRIIKKRMQSGGAYLTGMVPDGVDFLVAFVDIQKGRFAARVIGYSALGRESWLIDAYEITEWKDSELARRLGKKPMDKIDPFGSLADWSILEEAVINQSYPLVSDPTRHLPIARVGIDTGGEDDTTWNARKWAAGVIYRKEDPLPEWRILLTKGSSYKTGELYGIPRQVIKDDRGEVVKPNAETLIGPVWERTIIVHQLKKIIRRRQNVLVPGPGFMHAPVDLDDQYFREIVSEKLISGEWIPEYANETWDAYVACEVVRATLNPEDEGIDWARRPPSWARPFVPGVEAGIDTAPRKLISPYARMVRINRGQEG